MQPKAAFHNLGCKVNAYETEAMRRQLEEAGYRIVPFEEDADVYVINTCTVTNIADRKSRQMLHRAKKRNPAAIVAAVGCYAQIKGEELEKDPAIDLVIGTNRKSELLSLIEEFRRNGRKETECSDLRTDRTYEELQAGPVQNRTRAFIKVQDGCDRFCSYCIIPYARGRVRSRRMEDVCREAESLTSEGVKEIVLTGIHICSYGKDLEEGTDLTGLIRAVHGTGGLERLRLSSLEPSFITEETAEQLAALPKLCPHFHLSLQSGCDRTLRRMNRPYTTEEFAGKAELLRARFTDPALTTDIITGFPGETEEEFAETVRFVSDMHFFETHIFPYSRREGTRAAGMPGQLTEREKKERSRILLELDAVRREEFLETFLGRPLEVLFEEQTEIDGDVFWEGYGRAYQRVRVKSREELANTVRIVRPYAVRNGILLA